MFSLVSQQARWTLQRSLSAEVSSDGISGEAGGSSSLSRRSALGRAAAGSATAAWAALAAGSAPPAAQAVGPVNMELKDLTYETAECPPSLKAGRIGGAFGGGASKEVTQQCVKVTATAINPTKSPLKECAVFGFVLDEAVSGSEPCWLSLPFLYCLLLCSPVRDVLVKLQDDISDGSTIVFAPFSRRLFAS